MGREPVDVPRSIFLGLTEHALGDHRPAAAFFIDERYPIAGVLQKARGGNVIVVGAFSERDAEAIYRKPKRAIFINPFDMARPGQVRDGFFPDAVFADPRYIMPVIYAAIDEWLNGKPRSVSSFFSNLAAYGGLAAQVAF